MRHGRAMFAFAAVLASALLVGIIVTGNAKAWNMTPQDTSFDYSVHVNDNTIPLGVLCPAVDPTSICPTVAFTVSTTGSLAATATFPADQEIDVVVCHDAAPDLTVDNCPRGTEQSCTTATAQNVDAAGTVVSQTEAVHCGAVGGGNFELLFVPVFVATCPAIPDPLLPPCEVGAGVDVHGSINFTPAL